MKSKLMIGALVFGLSLVQAATYDLKLFQNSQVGGETLKAGDYRITVDGTKVTIKQGKHTVEANARVETVDQKFSTTSVRYDDKNQVQEIHVGGTKTKLVIL